MSVLIVGANRLIEVDVVTSGAYAAGDQLGVSTGLSYIKIPNYSLSSSGYGFIDEVRLVDTTDTPNAASLDFFFFTNEITGAGDNVAFSVSDAQLKASWQWKISTSGTTYTTVSSNGIGIVDCSKKLLKANKNRDLFMLIRVASGTPNFANGSLKLLIASLQG